MARLTTILSTSVQGTVGSSYATPTKDTTFQVVGTAAGAGSCVVTIKASNDGTNWLTIGTVTLTLINGSVSDGFALSAPWGHYQATATTLSTGNVVVVMGT